GGAAAAAAEPRGGGLLTWHPVGSTRARGGRGRSPGTRVRTFGSAWAGTLQEWITQTSGSGWSSWTSTPARARRSASSAISAKLTLQPRVWILTRTTG